jgi:hypothetical protein
VAVKEYENAFERFADVEARGSSPLYETLSVGVAEDDALLALAEEVPDDQPAPNLLFAAVQSLLFERPDYDLAAYYPSIVESAKPPDEDAYEAFRTFCLDHRTEILRLLRSRRVQTNVVRRCSILLPAFEDVSRRCDRTTLGLVEIGPSAGSRESLVGFAERFSIKDQLEGFSTRLDTLLSDCHEGVFLIEASRPVPIGRCVENEVDKTSSLCSPFQFVVNLLSVPTSLLTRVYPHPFDFGYRLQKVVEVIHQITR